MFPNSFSLASKTFFYIYSVSQLPYTSWGNKAKALTYIATLICLPLCIICSGVVFLVALNIEAGKKIKDYCTNRVIPATFSSEEDEKLLTSLEEGTFESETQVSFLPIIDTSIKSKKTSSDDQHLESETMIDFDLKLDSEPPHHSALYTPNKKTFLSSQTHPQIRP